MHRKTILLAEDDALLRDALTDKLTQEGFTVEVARDGEECVEKAFALRPDLILLDVLMPRKDGIAVLKALREDAWGATAKVVLLTNVTDAEEIMEANPYRSDGYLIKSDTKIADVVGKIKQQLDLSGVIAGAVGSGPVELPEHRCVCGKLLFKGTLLFSTVEIKCKRCGLVHRVDTADEKMLG